MSEHIPPSDFKELIPSVTSSLCDKFVSVLIRLPTLIWQWMVDVTKTDGTINGVAEIGDYMFSSAPEAETDYRKLCKGQELLRTAYPDLFALIGELYGEPSTSEVFKLPDFRGRMPVGVGNFPTPSAEGVVLGDTGGLQEVILDSATTAGADHTHVVGKFRSNSGSLGDGGVFIVDVGSGAESLSTVPTGRRIGGAGGSANTDNFTDLSGDWMVTDTAKLPEDPADASPHENMPPYLACYVYIRVK